MQQKKISLKLASNNVLRNNAQGCVIIRLSRAKINMQLMQEYTLSKEEMPLDFFSKL